MDIVQAVVLGFLQGVFEWLPVSSEAVVTLVMTRVFGSGVVESVNSAVWLHTGTMLAATLYFREDIFSIIEQFWSDRKSPFKPIRKDSGFPVTRFLFISTLITGILGGSIYVLGLKNLVGRPDVFSALTALALFATGIARFYRPDSSRKRDQLNDKDSLITGILQGFSIIPGISRSGSTVFGLFIRNFDAEEAFKISFLMSVPAILAANIGLELFGGLTISFELVIASLTAFISGYMTIGTVIKLADRAEVSIICFILGFISLIPLII